MIFIWCWLFQGFIEVKNTQNITLFRINQIKNFIHQKWLIHINGTCYYFFPYFITNSVTARFFLFRLVSAKNQWNMIDIYWKKINNLLKNILFSQKIMLDAWKLVEICNFILKIRIRHKKVYETNFHPINTVKTLRHFFHFEAIYLRKYQHSRIGPINIFAQFTEIYKKRYELAVDLHNFFLEILH